MESSCSSRLLLEREESSFFFYFYGRVAAERPVPVENKRMSESVLLGVDLNSLCAVFFLVLSPVVL